LKKIFETVKASPLFYRIEFSDFESMLGCLSAKTVCFKKNDIILLTGDPVTSVGIILSGSVKVIKEDEYGNIAILTELRVPDTFGEVFACAGIAHSPITVQASEDGEALLFDYKRIVFSCSSACPFHARLIENMLRLLAKKNLTLNQKIEILSGRTTREKLLRFFDAQRGASKKFTIPYNREELAHYLCVDRSAMSGELGRMRDEGLLRFNRNEFEILQ